MSEVNLIGLTKPSAYTECTTANELVAWAARVSNPSNQNNTATAPKLVQYLIKNQHWSPLEMVHVSMTSLNQIVKNVEKNIIVFIID